MAADRRLTEAFRPLAEALLPDRVLSQERAVGGALNDDATVRPESLTAALPWIVRDILIPGVVPTGANLIRLAMPQGGRIRHVGIAAQSPPSGGPLLMRLHGTGATESVSLQPGVTTVMAGLDLRVDPGAFLGITVASANGVENTTITLHYTVGGV